MTRLNFNKALCQFIGERIFYELFSISGDR